MKKIYLIALMFSLLFLSGCNKEKREEYRKAVVDGEQLVEDYRDDMISKIKANFGDTTEIEEPKAYIFDSGGIGRNQEYYCTRFIDTHIIINNQKVQVRYDIQTGRIYSSYVKLKADKELEEFLTTEMNVTVRKMNIVFSVWGVSHAYILETGIDYSFSELSKAADLKIQNNRPEIMVICIYDGELDVNKLEEYVKPLYQNNVIYEIQLCFIHSAAKDIKDLLEMSHDYWHMYVGHMEYNQINGKETTDRSHHRFDYKKIKTITSISNIHEKNKKQYRVFQFEVYNNP